MKLNFYIVFALIMISLTGSAQDVIYWSGSSANGNWDWGNGCTTSAGGNWYWNTSGSGDRSRPDCYASFNKIYFGNGANTIMNLNSLSDFSSNQIIFITGTPDRIINTDASRTIYFQNNNGNCKIENYATGTTHTFNTPIFVNSGNNYMEINPVNGFLNFTNTIRNNSNNPINIYGFQQVTFSGDIIGTPGVTINNTATVVYSGTSKIYSGITTINTGTKLKISSNQTLGALALNGGTLQIDPNVTLTITGTYSSITGSVIDNKGTIKFAGGSVTFPGNASVNNGTANTLAGFEVASSGTVTVNSLLRVTNSITVSSGTLLLGINDLRLNNASLNIAIGATFDNGGENQIINETAGVITISGTFITRDTQGFIGTNTAIPSITPTLNPGSTIEYGLNGNQAVQGSRSYFNLTFSNSGTKTLSSAITNLNTITGTVTIKDAAILDVNNKSFGGSDTYLTMTETSEFKTAGTGVKPDIGNTYSLGTGTKITFTNNAATLEKIRLAPMYYNIDIVGSSVGTDTATGTIDFQLGGTLTIKNTSTFKNSNTSGFSGGGQTSISKTNNPTITLEAGSSVEYAGANQTITTLPFPTPYTANTTTYSNLKISGTGDKKLPSTEVLVNNDLEVVKKSNVEFTYLKIEIDKLLTVANKITVPIDDFDQYIVIYNNGSLVQINEGITDVGNINLERITTSIINTDYTYWSSPVFPQTLYDLSPDTLDGMFYSYNSAVGLEGDWEQESSGITMARGRGYIVRGPEPSGLNPPPNYTANFLGVPNNGQYEITNIIENRSYLIGNPYPSALDADTFLTDNASVLDGTLYFWTHNTDIQDRKNITTIDPVTALTTAGSGAYAYTSDDYAVYNIIGGTESAPSDPLNPNGKKPTGKISSGQGFFASSLTSILPLQDKKIIFNNSMRVRSTGSNSQIFKTRSPKTKSAVIEKHRIWLDLKNSQGAFKQTLIGYITDATNEYDSRFDGETYDANEFVDFYSINQDKNLVIQGRALPFDENDEVPLGFRTTIEGAFTINIDQVDGVLTNQAVFIEDKLTNTVFDLKTGNYTFNTVAGTFNDRFILRYTNKTLGTADLETLENQVLISNKNKQIKVNSVVETIDKVLIYDLLGRQIYKKEKVNNNELTITNLVSSQQTVLVKVSLQNGQTVTKKIIF
jgi:hypothetical protein